MVMATDREVISTMNTVRQVARRLSVSVSVVYNEIRSGRLIAHRFGKKTYRISEANFQRYLAEAETSRQTTHTYPKQRAPTRQISVPAFEHLKVDRLLDAWEREQPG